MRNTVITPTKRKLGWSAAAAAITALTLSSLAAAPATAADTAPAPALAAAGATAPTITTQQVRDAHTAFQEAGIPFDVTTDDVGRTVNVYHFAEGDFGLVVPAAPGTISTQLAVGSDGEGTYISFNNADQRAIKNGTAYALVAAIGVLSPPMGVVAGFAVTIANEYVAGNGFCPGNDELWVYFTDGPTGPAYSQVICRPVSHPGGG